MTVLALKTSRAANAVSELHGQITRKMWQVLYPGKSVDEVPIGHITNGIHLMGWMKGPVRRFWRNKLGPYWDRDIYSQAFWDRLLDPDFVSDEEIWALRYRLRRALIEFARRRFMMRSMTLGDGSTFDRLLDPDALTIGFARRFATYKRAPLLFDDYDTIVKTGDGSAPAGSVHLLGKSASRGRRRQTPDPEDNSPQQIQRTAGPAGFYGELRCPYRAPDGVRMRCLAEHAAAADGGFRHQRAENPLQRRLESEHSGWLVARSLRRHQRICHRRETRSRPPSRSRIGWTTNAYAEYCARR